MVNYQIGEHFLRDQGVFFQGIEIQFHQHLSENHHRFP